MSRTVFKLPFSNFTQTENAIISILRSHNFRQTVVGSELIWKKGGTLIGGQCIKVSYADSIVVLEGWLTPNLGSDDEYALDGITGIIPRKQLLGVIEEIKFTIQ